MEYNGIKVLVSEGAFKEYKSEELKDIMEYLEDPDIYVEEHDYCYKRLSLNDTNILLDYINNLEYKIHKALEYINNNKAHEYRNGNDNEFYLELNEKEMNNLLDILKGKE